MSGKDKKATDRDKKATIAEGLQQVEKIVSALLVRQDSTPFREPVDWRQMNLLDYPEKVKKPMDLSTVKKLLAAGAYRTLGECADDVRRVWSNCKAYNPEGSDLHELSVTLSRRFEDKYEKIPLQLREMEDPHKDLPPSSEEKRRFADNMYRIKMDELSRIVSEIDARCPDALEKVEGCDEIEINLDKIDARTFHAVSKRVAEMLPLVYPAKNAASGAGHGGGKKKRKKDSGSSSAAAAAAAPSAAAGSSSSSKEHSGAASSIKHKKQKV